MNEYHDLTKSAISDEYLSILASLLTKSIKALCNVIDPNGEKGIFEEPNEYECRKEDLTIQRTDESTSWPICVPSVPTFGTRLKDGKRWYLCSKHSTSTYRDNKDSPYVFETMAGPGLASYISDPQTGELFHDHSRGGEDVPKEPFTKGIKIESEGNIFSLFQRDPYRWSERLNAPKTVSYLALHTWTDDAGRCCRREIDLVFELRKKKERSLKQLSSSPHDPRSRSRRDNYPH